ncbi:MULTISPECIES: DHA2 family efflux MFS transporter permease subunit [Luteibacter]|uniref:DHA2 family efflux MFS transporter permease subunit n=1 Tax=Luteibacter flocculans TaxID=2780091 RepID=A0ABY4T9I6_9GAMM|nr:MULTISPECIES: DHA2 family efflux MFS transporter permease subunit [Luteibacter]URL60015.1 DHA2 family efflux MFS transporter permease subunit [Luteibacter flocculans]SFW21514.1 drug resistance transporter, EmrB/QacA subfamily [Luteibacter sp. UNCMF366Tsu5.1]
MRLAAAHPRMTPAPGFRTVALIIASAMFMEQLDGTILATALPAMAESFGVSPLHMSVALTSYMLSLAVFIPASGAIADRYGSRNVFRAAIALFTLGSILCGVSGNLPLLVLSRLLQGIGGAMMVPVGRLVLLRSVPKSELVSAMSWLLVPALIGPVVGPPLGGFIVTWVSWRWIFYINVPIGVAGIWLASKYIPDVRLPDKVRFDTLGFVLSGVSLSCLVFGLEMVSHGASSVAGSTVLIVVGLVVGALYVAHARRVEHPILDLSLMRFTTFRLSVIAGSLTRITAGAMPFLLPLMMQLGFGLSAAHSGVVTFVSALGAMLMKATAAPVLRLWGFRATLVWNGVLSMLCVALCAAFRPDWPLWTIYTVLLLSGFFQSLQFSAYNTVAYADVPSERFSSATSFYTTFQQLMLSLGICVAAAALHASVSWHGREHAQLPDFSAAFLVVTLISLIAAPVCARLPRNAGAEMSGHRAR